MFYLGVDGGGTKTAFMLINEEGKIVAYKTKGTCHYVQIGMDNFYHVISQGIAEVTREAGLDHSVINYAFFGLAGYGEEQKDVPFLEAAVRDSLKSARFTCRNDVEAGWAGSLACKPGINLVGGTGSIGFGKDQAGESVRAGGWGYFCGDEGSAYWLGKKLISLFGKQADGRQKKTPLYEIIRGHFNLTRDFDLITVVYDDLEMKREHIAKLALLLYEGALQGDEQALGIYQEAAYEYSLITKALIDKLNFCPEEEILVSYSGGVFKAGDFVLKPLQDYIANPRVRLVPPVLQPVTGAALYAYKLGAEEKEAEIIDNLAAEEKRVGLAK